MDAAHGSTAVAVTRLSLSIREYSFFQGVLAVLEQLRKADPEQADEAIYERLEFRANPSLGFPGSDIESVEFFSERDMLRARLYVNLAGLSGAGSPLPAFYAEQALGDSAENIATRDFLDLFNHRLQRLMLPIWRKYRYQARFASGARDPFSAQMFSLIGLGGETIRLTGELNWRRLLPYLGLLSMRAQSATLIEAVLKYYFKHAGFRVEQCVERMVTIARDQRSQLGFANSGLGTTLVLGERVRDRSGKFRVHVTELTWDRFHEFLPGGEHFASLGALVRFVLRDPLDHDIQLHMRPDQLKELRLGKANPCRLGWTSWLGGDPLDPSVTLTAVNQG